MKTFKIIFILTGVLLLGTVVFLGMSHSLPQEDINSYNSALKLSETMNETVWPGYRLNDYPAAIRYKDREYVVFNGQITERQPVLKTAANTARQVDGKANIFILDIKEMEVMKEFSEGLGSAGFLMDKFSLENKSMTEAEYITLLYHEGFHAFQIQNYSDSFVNDFLKLSKKYDIEKFLYIINTKGICDLYKPEALILGNVFQTYDREGAADLAERFLDAREIRYQRLSRLVSNDEYTMIIEFEDYYEKLEGTATYINLKTAEILGDKALYNGYKDSVLKDFNGTRKFYNTGMGMCFLLDKLSAEWKKNIFTDGIPLDETVQRSLEGSN